jgi:hypothetical protein
MITWAKWLLCLPALCAASPSWAESAWAVVPSSLDARSMASLTVPEAATEADVRLVGVVAAPTLPAADPHHVVCVDVCARQAGLPEVNVPTGTTESRLPEGVRWPDSSGRIVAVLPEKGASPSGSIMRNPWEIRIHPRQAGNESVFACGGIVAGGAFGPIAIVNGRVVRQGDALGRFRIACILREGVVLGRDGLLLVLPVGRSTTVSTIGG